MSNEDLRKKIRDFLKGPDDKIEAFLKTMTYLAGQVRRFTFDHLSNW